MVEQEAVNFEVAGSSPVPGATNKKIESEGFFFIYSAPYVSSVLCYNISIILARFSLGH